MHTMKKNACITHLLFLLGCFSLFSSQENEYNDEYAQEEQEEQEEQEIIKNIFISGNKFVSQDTIRAKLPFKIGDIFDERLSSKALSNVLSLGSFTAPLELFKEPVGPGFINLHLKVTEKLKLADIAFTGNTTISGKELEKKLKLSTVPAIDKHELVKYVQSIKKLYREKNLHNVTVDPQLTVQDDGTARITFVIVEGKKSVVKRVFFRGNKCVSSRILRTVIFTREDWVGSFFDKAGTYHPDAIEQDKYTLENYYQSNGYLTAQVTDTQITKHGETGHFDVTFTVHEGPLYTVAKVTAPGNEYVAEEALLSRIPVAEGKLYSREALRQSIEILKLVWGEFGFIYADVEPDVFPDHDNKTVSIEFKSELGAKVMLNRITLRGNKKTRDAVIRRKLLMDEGETLTTRKMDDSKRLVQGLGYFDQREGVNWRIIRLQDDLADLELILREVKTGKLYAQINYGSVDKSNPSILSSFKIGVGFSDRNFLGTGVIYDFQGSYSQQERNIGIVITNPWMFDRPLLGALTSYYKQATYEDLKNIDPVPVETLGGGVLTTGFRLPQLNDLQFNYDIGGQDVTYKARPLARFSMPVPPGYQESYQRILDREFQAGGLVWLSQNISQDTRNSPLFPTRGHFVSWISKVGTGGSSCGFGFFRTDVDTVWYTPLIGEFDLIFAFHSHLGIIVPFSNRTVPYRELYHIGGPTTVRGYTPGDLGPSFAGDSIGATRAFYLNAELIFPFTKELTTKARIFYDGGSGWGFVGDQSIDNKLVRNNMFNYRHAIGFGVQMVNPQPLRIDIGFKLDRNQRLNESPYEISFTMAQDFW